MVPKLTQLISYLDSLKGRADLGILRDLLEEAPLNISDLSELCKFGDSNYKRNLISSSPWYDLLLICWRPGQCTPIHDHLGSSCAFRVVAGSATELRFERVTADPISDIVHPVAKRSYFEGELCLAEDSEIHKISNSSATENLITLHIYSPPLHMNYFRDSEDSPVYRPEEAHTS